jgi:pimeloyl-ACP methyl ester carboxylesterase
VRSASGRDVHRTLTANVLSTGEPSVPTRHVLQRLGLAERFDDDPAAALAELGAAATSADRLFALAELSFWLGEERDDPARHLAAAVYAYAFLFPEDGAAPEPTDPRYRLACDLYNRALTEGLDVGALGDPRWRGETVETPAGSLELRFDPAELEWSGWRLREFLPAADLEVRGLRNRYRRAGVGAPLVASLSAASKATRAKRMRAHILPRLKVPVTALLRVDDVRGGLATRSLRARLELISPDEASSAEIGGRSVPLEFETSSALAYTAEGPPIWWDEIRSFLYGGVLPRLGPRPPDQLVFFEPYRRGRIPLVLVHGTASSAARWIELVNELVADPAIMGHYQIWLYTYETGNPIGLSAGAFREALSSTLRELDLEGSDPALARMVVVGHSQGGLLAKLTAVESGDRFWRNVAKRPIDEMKLTAEERAVLERSSFFTPLPFVKRIVYIATPHQGSYLTLRRAGRWLAGVVRLPNALTQLMVDVIARNRDDLLLRELDRPASALDNMTPGNPFLATLRGLTVAPSVTTHSIIAVRGDGPPAAGRDGVVEYASAHEPGAASELVVRSGHSCQGNPATIEEVRRILRVHAGLP